MSTGRPDPRRRRRRRRPRLRPIGSSWTTRGRCLLAGGVATAVCALVLNERDLLVVGVFVCALPVLAVGLIHLVRAGVRAERVLDPPRLAVGRHGTVRLLLRQSGSAVLHPFGPGQLTVSDAVPDPASGTTGSPAFGLTGLPRGAQVELRYPLTPVLRGRYPIGPLTAHGTDPLGLADFELTIARPSALLVLPTVVALSGVPASLGADLLETRHAHRQQGPGSPDVTVREYRYGDDLRKVHWRSTARLDELMVRVEERAKRGGVTILLDRRVVAHRGRGPHASLEWAVSMAASAYLHLTGRGIAVALVTEDGLPVAPGRTGDAVLDALAELAPTPMATLSGPALPGAGADAMIAVLGATDAEDPDRLIRRAPTPSGHALLLDVAGWTPPVDADHPAGAPFPIIGSGTPDEAARTLRAAGWTATVVRAGVAVDVAWERLCASVPVRR